MTWEDIVLHQSKSLTAHSMAPFFNMFNDCNLCLHESCRYIMNNNLELREQISKRYYVWHRFQIKQFLITVHMILPLKKRLLCTMLPLSTKSTMVEHNLIYST